MRILWIDPGGTTGWALWNSANNTWERGQIGPHEHEEELWNFLWEVKPELLGWEEFTYQRRELSKGVQLVLISRDYIGVCKLYTKLAAYERNPCERAKPQMPSCMGFWTDEKLKKVGLYIPGAVHANDATRHLLYYKLFTMGDRSDLNRLSRRIQDTNPL